jgi:hypothetical protein
MNNFKPQRKSISNDDKLTPKYRQPDPTLLKQANQPSIVKQLAQKNYLKAAAFALLNNNQSSDIPGIRSEDLMMISPSSGGPFSNKIRIYKPKPMDPLQDNNIGSNRSNFIDF